jgi:Uma2 family endonuclease
METELLTKVLQRPDVYLFIDRVQAALELERAKRAHFYEIIEENRKMEFINGEIIFHSPVRLWHNEATGFIYQMMDAYVRRNKLGKVGIEKLLVSLTRNDYEPDVCFWLLEKSRHFTQRQAQFPAPDFVVEVLSKSTEANDRGIKFDDYEAHGVGEYWLVDPEKQVVEQYVLEDGRYDLRLKASDGSISSTVITGFTIPIKSIFQDEENARVLEQFWKK